LTAFSGIRAAHGPRTGLPLVRLALIPYRQRRQLQKRSGMQKEAGMRSLLIRTVVLATITLAATTYVANVQATPASGFTGSTLAMGRFGDIDVSNHQFLEDDGARDASGHRHFKNLWLSFQKTKSASDLYVQSNVWQPGGTTGWHTHPGHSLIIVTAGTVTAYEGDDRRCRPHVYTAGMGFVDEGGDHVHVIRNEGAIEARTIAVQLIPAGADRRADGAPNLVCGF
jgi:hypothetical protein